MDTKTCPRCNQTFPATAEYFNRASRTTSGLYCYCKTCGRAYKRENAASQPAERRESRRIYCLLRVKQEHMKCLCAYGGDPPTCACCGETEIAFLTLDHISGDGKAHKDALGQKAGRRVDGYVFYRWLIDNDFPPGLQVLCWNCNFAKRTYRACPHQPNGGNRTRRALVSALGWPANCRDS